MFRVDEDLDYYYAQPPNLGSLTQTLMHPFAMHLVFLFKGALSRCAELENLFHHLLTLETRLLRAENRVTAETAQDTKVLLQDLHGLFREMVAGENVNKRDLATANGLLNDLERLKRLANAGKGLHPLDEESHQRMIDGFLCLKSFCEGREVRLANRSRRVENLIGLVRFLYEVLKLQREIDQVLDL